MFVRQRWVARDLQAFCVAVVDVKFYIIFGGLVPRYEGKICAPGLHRHAAEIRSHVRRLQLTRVRRIFGFT